MLDHAGGVALRRCGALFIEIEVIRHPIFRKIHQSLINIITNIAETVTIIYGKIITAQEA